MSRWSAARVVAALAAVSWGLFFYGPIDLLVPVDQAPGFYETYLLETGWGVLYFGLVGIPLACVAVRPALESPVAQVAVAGLAVGGAAILTAEWLQLVPAAGLFATAAVVHVLTHGPSSRQDMGRRSETAGSLRGWLMLLLAAASVVPAVIFAWDMISGTREGRPPRDNITNGLDHWPMQAGLALAMPAMALLAARQLRGSRVTAWTTAGGAAWMGGFSVAYPTHAGSFGRAGGWLAPGRAALFVLASVVPGRRAGCGRDHGPSDRKHTPAG